MLHSAFRAAGERATYRNVGHGDISWIRKVRDTLRSTRGCLLSFYHSRHLKPCWHLFYLS